MTLLINREFRSNDRNPNANGDERLLTVTESNGMVRLVVSGVQGSARTLVTLSDVTVPVDVWHAHKDLILAGLQS